MASTAIIVILLRMSNSDGMLPIISLLSCLTLKNVE